MLAGAKGNRFDLTLNALYFRESELTIIPYSEYEEVLAANAGTVVPMNTQHSAQRFPIVGVGFEYFECRELEAVKGTLPRLIGDVVLGAGVSTELGLKVGDALFSDQREIYDISKPPALKMLVAGILAATGTADDGAVFADIKTIWILEGIAHGHRDVETITDPKLLYGKTEETVVVSPAFIEYNEVTAATLDSYHAHADPSTLPLTSILVWPRDDKAGTILKGDVNISPDYQMVDPEEVIADLMAVVFRVKSIFDNLSMVLGGSTVLLIALVVLLSIRIRQREILTLHRIGCSRFAVTFLYANELGMIVGVSVLISAGATLVLSQVLPNLIRVL